MISNYLSDKYLNIPFDKDGNCAKSGKILQNLLENLEKLEFFEKKYPKSIGREWVMGEFYSALYDEK